MADIVSTPKPYQLVQFIRAGRQPVTRSVDLTLLQWIRYDNIKKKFVSKYLPEPYTDERTTVLYDFIKRQVIAPKDWLEYTIKIVGHADTYYEQGVERLNVLKFKELAYTTESEMPDVEKKALVEEQLKTMDPAVNDDIQSILNVSNFMDANFNPTIKTVPDPLAVIDSKIDDNESSDKSDKDTQIPERKSKQTLKRKRVDDFKSDTDLHNLLENQEYDVESYVDDDYMNNRGSHTTQEYVKKSSQRKSIDKENLHNKTSKVKTNIPARYESDIDDDYMNSGNSRRSQEYKKSSLRLNSINKGDLHNKITKVNTTMPAKYEIQRIEEEIKHLTVKFEAKFDEILQNQREIKMMLEVNNTFKYIGKQTFEEEFNIHLPFQDIVDFRRLNEELRTQEECCNRFKSTIDLCMSKEMGIRKSLNTIFKKFFSQDFIMQFTSTKKVPDKDLMKDFIFCTHLLEVACTKYEKTQEEALIHIGVIISNAKDWGGRRKERMARLAQ